MERVGVCGTLRREQTCNIIHAGLKK